MMPDAMEGWNHVEPMFVGQRVEPLADAPMLPPVRAQTVVPAMRQPLWSLNGEHSTKSVGALMRDVIQLGENNNLPKQAMIEIVDLIRKCLPTTHVVPNFRSAENTLLEACAVKAKEYAVCPHDCMMVRTPLAELTPKHIKSVEDAATRTGLQATSDRLREPCGTPSAEAPYNRCPQTFTDGKGRVLKVRQQATQTSEQGSFEVIPLTPSLLSVHTVEILLPRHRGATADDAGRSRALPSHAAASSRHRRSSARRRTAGR